MENVIQYQNYRFIHGLTNAFTYVVAKREQKNTCLSKHYQEGHLYCIERFDKSRTIEFRYHPTVQGL